MVICEAGEYPKKTQQREDEAGKLMVTQIKKRCPVFQQNSTFALPNNRGDVEEN